MTEWNYRSMPAGDRAPAWCEPPRLSFVIACYNGRDYLRACLASIRQAEISDAEVVVVDDGSHEDIRVVVEFAGLRARYIRQPNLGPAAARNTGIRAAAGQYIAFLDSDDLLLSGAGVAAQVALLDAHPEVGLVHAGAVKIDARGRRFGVRKPAFARASYVRPGHEELADLLRGNYITTSTVVARRSALEHAGLFRTELPSGEDWDLWLRVARHAAIAYVDTPTVAYRVHTASLTARNGVDSLLRVHLGIVARAFEDDEIARRFGGERRLIEARIHERAARRAYRSGELALVYRQLAESIRRGGARQLLRAPVLLWLAARTLIPSTPGRQLRGLRRGVWIGSRPI